MERKTTRERRTDSTGGGGGGDSDGGGDGSGGGGGGGVLLKVAVPVFEARLIKTLVQYLRWRGRGERRREKSGPGRVSNPLSEGFPN